MALQTKQIVGIAVGLALVGGVTIYLIHHASAPVSFPPKKPEPKHLGKRRIARRAPGAPKHTVPHPEHPGFFMAQPSPEMRAQAQRQQATPPPSAFAEYAPVAPPSWSPEDVQHAPPQPPVTYTPAPPMQADPGTTAPVSAQISPTYWSDLVHSAGLKQPKDRLVTVREAQHYLNAFGILPNHEHLAEDNILGPRTKNALSIFQEGHHLPMTGLIDRETSAALLYQANASQVQ